VDNVDALTVAPLLLNGVTQPICTTAPLTCCHTTTRWTTAPVAPLLILIESSFALMNRSSARPPSPASKPSLRDRWREGGGCDLA